MLEFFNRILLCIIVAFFPIEGLSQISNGGHGKHRYREGERLVVDSAQYKITYELKYVRNTMNRDNIRTVNMVLYPGKKSALFLDQDKAIYDSLYTEFLSRKVKDRAEKERIRNISRKRKSRYIVAQDFPKKGSVLMQEYFGGSEKRYVDSHSNQEWKIHNDRKNILGYDCLRATCHFGGRDYEAWYAEDIPISRGPYMFTGLPGLILELRSLDNEYIFTFIGFEKVPEPFPLEIYDRNVEIVSRDDFRFLKKYYNDNAAAAVIGGSGSIKLKLTPEEEKELEKRLNRPRPYNPIEKE